MTVNTFRTRCCAVDGVHEMSAVELLGKPDDQIAVHGHPRPVAQWHLATAWSRAIRKRSALGMHPRGQILPGLLLDVMRVPRALR
jgi:hypothetical protein